MLFLRLIVGPLFGRFLNATGHFLTTLGQKMTSLGSENDQPAFIKSRYRFGSLLDLQSGLEMALAGIGNEMDRSIAFGMHLKAILPPHLGPIGLRLGFA